jgi:mono/diheme cytochrome c family protein
MRREVGREGRSALRPWALIGGAILACGLLAFWILNRWSAEPLKEGEHHDHQMMMQHGNSVSQQPGLATPTGWLFAVPVGDPHAGRQVFADFECFKCHEVRGEQFPAPKAEQGDVGSVLSGMGAMHPAEYFAEVIIDPNASAAWRITRHKAEHKGYLGADGKSKMPSYNETMTVQQLIDVVAYLKSLTAGPHIH